MLFTQTPLKEIWGIAFDTEKNKALEQNQFFLRKNDVQSVANGDRQCAKIGLRQCYIRPNRRNLTWFSHHSCRLTHAKSLVVHILARLWLNAHKA